MLPTLHQRAQRLWNTPFDLIRDLDRAWDQANGDVETYGAYGAYPVDIHEDDNHVYVEAEMPGFRKDQIDVTLENGVLTISAEREDKPREGAASHLKQRRFTKINRKFQLPKTVDDQKVAAKLDDGVLHLTLTKREEVRPRKIEVK
jgi:HSP20 family protein